MPGDDRDTLLDSGRTLASPFFFSSRRRHTRLQGDWSSDVCSSDLVDRLYQEQRKKTFVVLDEAHLLEDGLLEDLRLLTNYEMDTRDPLVLVLVGHPGLRLRLQRPVHQALWDRVRLSYQLEGLSAKETSDYIDCH